jgi:hypothetical protein
MNFGPDSQARPAEPASRWYRPPRRVFPKDKMIFSACSCVMAEPDSFTLSSVFNELEQSHHYLLCIGIGIDASSLVHSVAK